MSTHDRRPRARWRTLTVAVGLLAGLGAAVTLGTGPASAAVIDGAVQDITVTPTNPRPNELIRTTIDWCVPDGTQAGDTFTIELPEQLGGFPPGFELRDPDGELVATASISGNPVTATITMTNYAQTHTGVCGDAYFESRLQSSNTANTTQTLTYTVNGNLTIDRDIDVQGVNTPTRTRGVKRGEFTDPADQCRTSTTNCLEWVLTSRVGPFVSVTFEDLAADGLSFSCNDLSLVYWTVNPDGTRSNPMSASQAGATTSTACTSAGVTIQTGPVPADMLVRLRIPTTPDTPATNGADYLNVADISHETETGEIITDEVDAESRSASAGGSGSGVTVPPTTTTTVPGAAPTPPPTTQPPTTVPATTVPATPTTTPGVTTTVAQGAVTSTTVAPTTTTISPTLVRLPSTGSSSPSLIGVALALLAVGALLAGVAARRDPDQA